MQQEIKEFLKALDEITVRSGIIQGRKYHLHGYFNTHHSLTDIYIVHLHDCSNIYHVRLISTLFYLRGFQIRVICLLLLKHLIFNSVINSKGLIYLTKSLLEFALSRKSQPVAHQFLIQLISQSNSIPFNSLSASFLFLWLKHG